MTYPRPSDDATHDAAATWYARLLAPDCSASDRAGFEAWCAQDPSHLEAWLSVADAHEGAKLLQDDVTINVIVRRSSRAQQRIRRGWSARIALATAALLMLAFGIARYIPAEAKHYTNAIGAPREHLLEDGSKIVLDTDSEVAVRMDRDIRELIVLRGRVNIDVAQEGRSFVALARGSRVRDIGTEFQIALEGEHVRVVLIEGVVEVGTDSGPQVVRLSPGEQLRFDPRGAMTEPQAADLVAGRGWITGQLVFRDRRLDEVLMELNRYGSKPIRLADPTAGNQRVSGVLDIRDQEALLKALESGWNLAADDTSGGEIVLRSTARP
ncbi:FecR family protein [Dokdonella sp. MW10]|uniref:FecR family protein n=1 Tax=Dokdonella sp. MW10 TaxID=2992926 RepID=UPI003F82296B